MTFPLVPFDGQEFIDAYRMKWIYDASIKCWRRSGTVTDVPMASEIQNGLLSRRLKQLLDSIPEKGGHFGIVAKPLLSVVPYDIPTKLKDITYGAVKNESGSVVYGIKPRRGEPYGPSLYDGHFLRFTKGTLNGDTFLIYTNDDTSFILQGDASEARNGDEFIIYDPLQANENGVIMGDIELISDTLDITCVDNNGNPINFAKDCRLDYKDCDGGKQSPGLDIKVAEKVLDSFCIELRSCKGPRGDKGEKGDTGADGTGDGPQGEMGDPGQDAPDIAHEFTGIKFIDSDDIYDTAIIGVELDADAGKLHVLKAKLKVPDDDDPANQVIASPINRSLEWTDDEFEYKLLKPVNDPIEVKNTDDADVQLAAYPGGYEILDEAVAADRTKVTQFVSVHLSDLLDKTIAHFRERLEEIDADYNRQVKAFIEEKDAKARTILASLAQDLAECEWQLPIEFCLGITPDDCREDGGDGDGGDGGGGGGDGTPTPWPNPGDTPRFPNPPYSIPSPTPTPVPGGSGTPGPGFTPTPLPAPSPTPTPPPPPPSPTPGPKIVYSGALTWEGSTQLPANAAFAIRYSDGAYRTRSSAFFVSPDSNSTQEGLYFSSEVGGALTSPKIFPAQDYDPQDKNSVVAAYKREASTNYLVFGGDGPIDKLYAWIQANEELLPDSIVYVDVIALFDPADPIPGVKVNMTNTGPSPTPTPTPELSITAVNPSLIPELIPTPATAYGAGFEDGMTFEAIGNTPANIVVDNVAADGTSAEITIIIFPDPLYPAPNNYDILGVLSGGANAILIAGVVSGS